MCKSIMCRQCKYYWPNNSIMFMQNYCFNMKREFEAAEFLNDNLLKNKIKEFIDVSQEVSSFICPTNKRELSIAEKHDRLLREMSEEIIYKNTDKL